MKNFASILILITLFATHANATSYVVKNETEFNANQAKLKPGDTLLMANGIWKDVCLVFKSEGSEAKPIVLTSETPGKVSIEGESSLTLSGNFLNVSGLLFTNGHAPGSAVISFAGDLRNPSNHCRVSDCAIIGFNQTERFKADSWVAMYGTYNRFDHNYIAGKLNEGVTLAVFLDDIKDQANHHRIDHNYFGERKRLGSNGGETIRIGTSTYSLIPTYAVVEDNYFERCNGEVEAVSIKSTENIIRRNVFFECEGSLVLRHGNNNQVYENLFIGNGKPTTAGLRIVNAGHAVHDNYFSGLTGERFRSAFAVMNGVPSSAINRYHQVKNVSIYNNTFVDCKNIEFCVGGDNERTATPVNSSFINNTIYQSLTTEPIRFLGDVSGITFKDNQIFAPLSDFQKDGFHNEILKLEIDKSGLYQPILRKSNKQGNSTDEYVSDNLQQKQNAGPKWLKLYLPELNTKGKSIRVTNETGAIEKAVLAAAEGDTLVLVSSGRYIISRPLAIDKQLYICSSGDLKKHPELIFNDSESTASTHILLKNGGNLWLKGISFNGTTEAGNKATCAIKPDTKGMISPYWLKVEDCEFFNFNESRYSAFRAEKGSYADSIVFRDCLFHTISGDAISISAEKDDNGIYNAENVRIENCIFYNIMGSALDLYRGGNDESTLGPFLNLDHCLFENVNNKELGSVLRLIGVQYAEVNNSIFSNSGSGGRSVKFEETRWDHCVVSNCNLFNAGRIESFYNNVTKGEIYHIEPLYKNKNEFDFRLTNASAFFKGNGIGIIYK